MRPKSKFSNTFFVLETNDLGYSNIKKFYENAVKKRRKFIQKQARLRLINQDS